MYDIEFIIPVRNYQKYGDRINNLKTYGLINALNKKALVTLLIGKDSVKGVDEGWGPNIDINIVSQPFNLHVCKMFNYMSEFTEKEINRSRWVAKIDDDSANDISGLVDNLDLDFDHQREYYIVTELRHEEHPIDRDIAHHLGYGRWFQGGHKPIHHEKEGSFMSQAAVRRMLNTNTAKQFLIDRANVSDGWGDIGMAYAARMAKIFACEANFLSSNPDVERFSMFGGDLNHIHYVAEDANAEQFNILKQRLFWKTNTTTENLQILTKNEYLFSGTNENGKNFIISQIRLLENGTVVGSNIGPNETLWRLRDDSFEFLNPACRVTTSFDQIEPGFTRMKGRFKIDQSVEHSLRVIL